ncbi:MAG: AcrR family transcriptional regulator [Bradymonadia bacterium]|jgi:AcrR family transcriptional regulator
MARPINEGARDEQRRAILETAGRLFAERGFHQTGISAICEAVGMSPGGLYRYFPSKSEIIKAIVAAERSEALEFITILEASPDLRDGLVNLLVVCSEAAADASATALTLEVAAEGARNPEVGELVDGMYREFVGRMTGVLRTAQARGEVMGTTNTRAVAELITATADGLWVRPIRQDAAGEDESQQAIRLLVDGLLGPRP